MKVPVLFTLPKSIYDTLNCNTFDKDRNALTYRGKKAVVAHPPCRRWSKLKAFAKFEPGEKWLAVWAALKINRQGGVLEHPMGSTLWKTIGLPLPGKPSKFNGFTISVNQSWFGHPCEKKTLLYINGCDIGDLPPLPLSFNAIEFHIDKTSRSQRTGKKTVPLTWRKKTPEAFAKWLIQVVKIIEQKKKENG